MLDGAITRPENGKVLPQVVIGVLSRCRLRDNWIVITLSQSGAKNPSSNELFEMFQCHPCGSTVFLPECPDCGYAPTTPNAVDEAFDGIDTSGPKRPEPLPPAPYRKRLANFCDCDESDVMLNEHRSSSMPFRIFTSIGPYIGPKSTKLIHYFLHRIRHLVRHSDARWRR